MDDQEMQKAVDDHVVIKSVGTLHSGSIDRDQAVLTVGTFQFMNNNNDW